jgi:hypothetical protein
MQQGNRCPNCWSPVRYGQSFCQTCGKLLSTGCPYCGTAINPGARICPTCGASPGIGNTQQSNWNTQQQRWSAQQPGWGGQQASWGARPSSWWQQSGWASAVAGRRPISTRSLLIIILLGIIIIFGGIIFWQLGAKSDKAAPTISAVAVAYRGKISARIIWQTNEPCSSQVEYGRTTQYGSLAPSIPQDDPTTGKLTGVISHSMNLTNLKAGYTYHYRVRSKDAAGNEAISSDFSFKTEESTPFVLPD